MKKIILFLLIIIFISTQASALCELDDADIGGFQVNTCVTLWQTCPDCSFVNISKIVYPIGFESITNIQMTKIGTSYNYTFCNTTLNGNYVYQTYGNSSANGICTQNVNFHITPNGEQPSTAQAFFYIGLLALLVFFLCLIFWAHLQDESHLARFWWFSFMWIPIWAIIFVAWNMARSFLTSQGAIEGILFYGWLTIGICYPFFLLGLVLYTFYWIYQQKEVQKLINRGFSVEDAESKVGGRKRGKNYG